MGHAAGFVEGVDEPCERAHRRRDGVAVPSAARGRQGADLVRVRARARVEARDQSSGSGPGPGQG